MAAFGFISLKTSSPTNSPYFLSNCLEELTKNTEKYRHDNRSPGWVLKTYEAGMLTTRLWHLVRVYGATNFCLNPECLALNSADNRYIKIIYNKYNKSTFCEKHLRWLSLSLLSWFVTMNRHIEVSHNSFYFDKIFEAWTWVRKYGVIQTHSLWEF